MVEEMSQDRGAVPRRILVVDDEDSIRDAVATALRYAGFTVDEARNGRDALAEAERFGPDLVILDWKLPEIDGAEVSRLLTERGPHVPILFLTAADGLEQEAVALGTNESCCITKPFGLDDVLARVEAMLRRVT
jgi:two-component system OmpR family response regulator